MKNNKIIIAMDMEISEGMELLKEINKYPEVRKMVYGYKIGSLWILERGVDILAEVLRETAKHILSGCIILDMQKWGTDIPDIIKKQVEKVAPYVDELICCPMGAGRESLKMFAETCIENNVKPICVLEMTHPQSDRYLDSNYYKCLLNDAINNRILSFVIPSTKTVTIDKIYLFNYLKGNYNIEKYATGFKVQGGQTKPMVDFGVTKFIVGRAVYEAENPIEAIRNIYKEINVFQQDEYWGLNKEKSK